ncbi:response regulator [Sungkyunkwania multivorans]|uniref:histidine kinase n=1 Tax=Sungkyunkwania multivorans TaxID=1173618 RepID=A0ABW3CVU3_9FLAO
MSFLFGVFLFLSCEQKPEILSPEERLWLDEHPELIAAINPTYPPYQFINEQDQLDGIFIGFVNIIEERLDYKFRKVLYNNWQEILDEAKAEKIDMIIEIEKTASRKEYLNFTEPLVSQPHVLVTKKDNENTDLSSFFGKKVAVIQGYAIAEHLKKTYPQLLLFPVINDEHGFELVASGTVEAYVSTKAISNYFINRKGYDQLKNTIEIDHLNKLGVASRKDLTVLSSILNKAVNSISDEEKKEIFDNWSYTIVKPTYKKAGFWTAVAAVILGLLLLASLFNRYLRYCIKNKTNELEVAKKKAEDGNRLKTAFIQNISHEIRTPLNGITGFADLIAQDDISKSEKEHYAEIIKNSSKQLMRIIDDILEISRLDTNQVSIQPEVTNINYLMQELVAIYELQVLDSEVELKLVDMDMAPIVVDKSKVRKIISILLDNAIKNTDEGEIVVTYRLSKEYRLVIEVSDTGKGISEEEQRLIFQKFKKRKDEKFQSQSGLGLGLTIAKENAELLGGSISVESKKGYGATFTVTIPFEETSADIENDLELHQNGTTALDSHKERHILIAEDGEVNFLFLSTTLKRIPELSTKIYRAKNGEEAIDIFQKNADIDLVLMDIMMPIMNGYEATKRIKHLKPEIPVIMQTAYSNFEDREKAIKAGCDDFISKPIDKDTLKKTMLQHLRY